MVKNLLANAGDVRDRSSVCRSETLGVGDGQGGLAHGSPWGREKSDTTERLN